MDVQARGSGRQKREAKQAACAELIETLKKMGESRYFFVMKHEFTCYLSNGKMMTLVLVNEQL